MPLEASCNAASQPDKPAPMIVTVLFNAILKFLS